MKLQQLRCKILLVQITNKNYGDSVIADNTRFLLKRAIPRFYRDCVDILDYAIQTEDLEQAAYADAIVFAGGGLVKFQQENLYRQVTELIMEAEKYHIPVFLNAVGVEGYDARDERCKMLVEALNQPCVKAISVRDDIDCLKKHYLHQTTVRVRAVYDPAIWSVNTYHMKGKVIKGRKYIGLGVARDTLFADYGIPSVNHEFLLKLWKDITILLESRGYEWKIFTNGLDQDEKFAEEVLQEIGHGQKCVQPFNASDLVNEISEMDGMIACRMHSNIIAYALGIPSIGLVWNDKMIFWGEKCGYPERFLSYSDFKAEKVVDALENALKETTRGPSPLKKHITYREIQLFMRKFCKPKKRQENNLNPEKHMVAAALGGCDFRYKSLNSIPQMWDSLQKGYRLLELDVRFSADEQLVCINGWKVGMKKALGLDTQEGEIDAKEFSDSQYYHHFPTCTFEQFLDVFSHIPEEYSDIRLILDVGKPKIVLLDSFYVQLTVALRKYGIPEQNVMVRMQRERDIEVFERQNYDCKMVYFLPEETAKKGENNSQYQQILQFCKKKRISIISMTEKTWTEKIQRNLKRQGLQTMVLTYTKAGDILTALRAGADFVASNYYDVAYINKLL